MILRARFVVTMDGPPIENGAVAVEGNRITAVGFLPELAWADRGPIIDLGEMVLLPGLINIHCHLDYSTLRHAIDPPRSFTGWVQRINAIKRSLDDADYLAAIAAGFAEARRWGTTTIGNVESFPELMPRLPASPLRTWWFYEMIDIRHRLTSDEVVAGALAFFEQRGHSLDRYGLSPHSPYTASVTLYQLANECAANATLLLTTHVAESYEELAMFRDARGPLFEFLRGLQRPMNDSGGRTPFSHLWRSGAINGDWILIHMNELTDDDFHLLASLPRGTLPHVVHCPGSHRYFRHAPFQFGRLQDLGVNISVATDSLASTDSLSLLGELRALQKTNPWLAPEQLLRTITVNPARALKRSPDLGKIAPGALADLIALPSSSSVREVHEQILSYTQPIPWMMLDGNVVS